MASSSELFCARKHTKLQEATKDYKVVGLRQLVHEPVVLCQEANELGRWSIVCKRHWRHVLVLQHGLEKSPANATALEALMHIEV
jgi:hypothetical protein